MDDSKQSDGAPMRTARPRPTVRAYLASQHLVRRGAAAAKTLLDGVWLGLLRREALHEVDAVYYGQLERLYLDPLYNRRGLSDWETRAVRTYFAGRANVIVTGAGGGREIPPLVRLGHQVSAYECNPGLLAVARTLLDEENVSASLDLMARDRWPESAAQGDAVMVGWGSYMLIRGRQARVEFLRGARAALPVGAPILLSFFVRSTESTYFPAVERIARITAWASGNSEKVELGDALVPNFAHHFSVEEISRELADGGFTLVESATEPYGWAVGIAR